MRGGVVSMDYSEIAELSEAAARFGDGAEDAVSDVLHSEAGAAIYERINPLIHQSGRRFKGHTASAARADWPRYDTDEALAVTVGAKARWRYLYFPDDGSATARHAGNQRFFERGAEQAAPEIARRCVDRLLGKWNEE